MDSELDAARVLLAAHQARRREASVVLEQLDRQMSEAKGVDARAAKAIETILELYPELGQTEPGPELALQSSQGALRLPSSVVATIRSGVGSRLVERWPSAFSSGIRASGSSSPKWPKGW